MCVYDVSGAVLGGVRPVNLLKGFAPSPGWIRDTLRVLISALPTNRSGLDLNECAGSLKKKSLMGPHPGVASEIILYKSRKWLYQQDLIFHSSTHTCCSVCMYATETEKVPGKQSGVFHPKASV